MATKLKKSRYTRQSHGQFTITIPSGQYTIEALQAVLRDAETQRWLMRRSSKKSMKLLPTQKS